jgi:hypothetical protein
MGCSKVMRPSAASRAWRRKAASTSGRRCATTLARAGSTATMRARKLVQVREMLPPEVVDAAKLLECSALEGPADVFLRGGADFSFVLYRAQCGED